MFAIFWNTIKDKKIAILIYCFAAMALLWMYIAMYPSILEQAEDFQKAFESYPTAMFEAMGVEQLAFDTIEKFIAMEHYSIMWPLMMMFFMVSLAGFAISKEIETGTAEILLSRPVSRLQIFFARYLAGILLLVIFCLVSVYMIIPLATLHNIDYVLENHNIMFILNLLFAWAIFSISMMFSAIFSEKGKMYGIISGMLVLMYAAKIASSLLDKIEDIKYATFFYYYDFNNALFDGAIEWTNILLFVGVAIITTVIGAYYFNKRDIAV